MTQEYREVHFQAQRTATDKILGFLNKAGLGSGEPSLIDKELRFYRRMHGVRSDRQLPRIVRTMVGVAAHNWYVQTNARPYAGEDGNIVAGELLSKLGEDAVADLMDLGKIPSNMFYSFLPTLEERLARMERHAIQDGWKQ